MMSLCEEEVSIDVVLNGSARHGVLGATYECNDTLYHPRYGEMDAMDKREQRQLVSFPVGRKVKLTPAQRTIVATLAVGQTVALAASPGIESAVSVVLGTGLCLARVSLESLLDRGLIEEAGRTLGPFNSRFFHEAASMAG